MNTSTQARTILDLTGSEILTPWSTLIVGAIENPRASRYRSGRPIRVRWLVTCDRCESVFAVTQTRILNPMKTNGTGPRTFCLACRASSINQTKNGDHSSTND